VARVLVIDDDPDLQEMLRFLLTQHDHQVLQAVDGLEGLRLALHEHPEVIVLDVMMPAMDGHEVLRRLKSLHETRHIPVVMLTAVSSASHVQSLVAAGADDYIIKPFEPHALLARLGKAIEANSQRNALLSNTPAEESAARLTAFIVARRPDWQTDLLARRLRAYGRVMTASDGLDALDMVLHEDHPVLFASERLNRLPGLELVQRLQPRRAAGTVYLVGLASSPNSKRARRKLLTAGFDDILLMPPTVKALNEVVGRATSPRSSYAQVHDEVVVLVVVSLDGSRVLSHLRDTLLDFLEGGFKRLVVDLEHIDNLGPARIRSLLPLLKYLLDKGCQVKVVHPDLTLLASAQSETPVDCFPSVEEAIRDWA